MTVLIFCSMLCEESMEHAQRLIQQRVVHHLMYAMGNQDYADSQRQSSLALEFLCRTFPIVDEHVRDAVSDSFYTQFMVNVDLLPYCISVAPVFTWYTSSSTGNSIPHKTTQELVTTIK